MTNPADEPIRTAAELEARTARLSPERVDKLEASCKWLLDRLAVSVGTSIRCQMNAEAEECEALADIYEDGANFLLSEDRKWTARREGVRGHVGYERAVIRIREALSEALREGK